jgi:hypothetical protein
MALVLRPFFFTGTNINNLTLQPNDRASLFPFFMTHRSGIAWKLIDWMRPLLSCSVSMSQFARIVLERYAKRWAKLRNQYMTKMNEFLDEKYISETDAKLLPKFSERTDKAGFDARCPTDTYFLVVYKRVLAFFRGYFFMHIQLNGIPARLQTDHSKKIVKHLMQYYGTKYFSSLFSGADAETGQIRCNFAQHA